MRSDITTISRRSETGEALCDRGVGQPRQHAKAVIRAEQHEHSDAGDLGQHDQSVRRVDEIPPHREKESGLHDAREGHDDHGGERERRHALRLADRGRRVGAIERDEPEQSAEPRGDGEQVQRAAGDPPLGMDRRGVARRRAGEDRDERDEERESLASNEQERPRGEERQHRARRAPPCPGRSRAARRSCRRRASGRERRRAPTRRDGAGRAPPSRARAGATSRAARGCGAGARRVTRKPSRPANAVSAPIAKPRSAAVTSGHFGERGRQRRRCRVARRGLRLGRRGWRRSVSRSPAAGLESLGAETVKEYAPSIGCPSSETMRHSTR